MSNLAKKQVLINLQGGVVQDIMHNLGPDVEILIVDWDVDSEEEDHTIVDVPDETDPEIEADSHFHAWVYDADQHQLHTGPVDAERIDGHRTTAVEIVCNAYRTKQGRTDEPVAYWPAGGPHDQTANSPPPGDRQER